MDEYTLFSAEGRFLLELKNYYLKYPYDVPKGHNHHFLEISFVKSGNGFYRVDERKYSIHPSDVFIFNNVERHDIYVNPGEDMINMVIHFEPQFIWGSDIDSFDAGYLQIFYNRNENFSNCLDRKNPATKSICALILNIETEFKNQQPGYELMIKVHLLNILAYLIRYYAITREPKREKQDAGKHFHAMNNVMEYIQFHLFDDIQLEELAKIAYISPAYFSTFFKKYNGLSPFEYISRLRIHRALEYLKSSNKSISEIACLCGFNNASNFNRTFKKVTGNVPSFYRK